MSLGRIEIFVKVVELGSFSEAARSQKISTAAVSKQIALLESEAKIKLLDRTTRRVRLTEGGQAYFQQCKKVLSEYQIAQSLLSHLSQEPAGDLFVVSARYFGEAWIVPFLREFQELYPKILLDLELAERMPDLEKENVDLIFGMSMAGPLNSIQKKLTSTRYVLCASPDYLKQFGVPRRISDLKNHRYITHRMRKPDSKVTFKNKLEIHIDPVLRLNDTGTMLECALQGMGIVKLHDYVVQNALDQGSLIEILPGSLESQIPVYLYYREGRYLQPKVRHFIDFFSARINSSKV
jgi:DNA-binding transcriptional LysR family regulator